jgi:hypothetical protein
VHPTRLIFQRDLLRLQNALIRGCSRIIPSDDFVAHPFFGSNSQYDLDFERKRNWLQKIGVVVAIRLSFQERLRRNLWPVKGWEFACRQAKRATDELRQPPPTLREKPGTASGIRDEFQPDEHETH